MTVLWKNVRVEEFILYVLIVCFKQQNVISPLKYSLYKVYKQD